MQPDNQVNRATSIVFEWNGRARGIEGVAREVYRRRGLSEDKDFHITEKDRAVIAEANNRLYRRVDDDNRKFIDASGRIDYGSSRGMMRARDFTCQAENYIKSAPTKLSPK